jgi:hypothetical protein
MRNGSGPVEPVTLSTFVPYSFIPPATTTCIPRALRDGGDRSTSDVKPKIGPEPLLRLTTRQESRLRTHLDGRLTDLERDAKTQYALLPIGSWLS